MIAYTRAKVARLLKIEFVRFSIVGALGFVINLVILLALTKYLKAPTLLAQFVGAEVALFSNFILHHNWTYRSRHVKKSISSLIIQFHSVAWPAIIGSSIMVSVGVNNLHLTKIVALVISSVVVFAWNFAWTKLVVWRAVTPQIKEGS